MKQFGCSLVDVLDIVVVIDQDDRVIQTFKDRKIFVLFVCERSILFAQLIGSLVCVQGIPFHAVANLEPVEEPLKKFQIDSFFMWSETLFADQIEVATAIILDQP